MLNIFFFNLFFTSFITCQNVTTTVASVINNQTVFPKSENNHSFLPSVDFTPLLNYNYKTPVSSYYFTKGSPNSRNTAVQYSADPVSYLYDSNYNFGHHPIVEHENEFPLKPSPRHFIVVSFIGLLLLFAVIQNTMEATRRKTALVDALSARKRRDLSVVHKLNNLTPEEEDIFNDDARLRCLQWMICLQNHKLLQDFGTPGKSLATYLTQYFTKNLNSSSGWGSLVEDAAMTGLRGEDCNILYHDCN